MSTSRAAFGVIALMDVERDLDGILAVDSASFTNPWTRDMFLWEARNSDVARVYVYRADPGVRAPSEAARSAPDAGNADPDVLGYCAVWHVFDELHINNLAVLPRWRRHGLATELLHCALARAAAGGARRATLEVRASNQAARQLYERFGFRPAGIRKSYYTNPVEDALVLWHDLAPAAPA